MTLFTGLVAVHIVAGLVSLISFWGPVVARKGGRTHRRWGRVFSVALKVAGFSAIGMALLNLTLASDRHPVLKDRLAFEGLFGWMMLYLGLLALSMVYYGIEAARGGTPGGARPTAANLGLQILVLATASWCAWFGHISGQPLMIILALLGIGSSATFIFAMARPSDMAQAHVREHLKAMVGAGIAAYTAFLSVGLLRFVPAHVFNPVVWAAPSIVGVPIILFHLERIGRRRQTALLPD